MKIESKIEQPLLNRTVITASTVFEGSTPKREDIIKQVAKAAKAKEDNVIVKHIYTQYGSQNASIEAAIYKKIEDAQAVEHKKLMEKHVKKVEEKPAAEEKKEAVTEDKKEASEDSKKAAAEEKKEE